MSTLKIGVLGLLSSVSLLAIAPQVAHAAAAETPPQTSSVEEIVVTAQRREERLQRVPIAVTVLDAHTAEALGVRGTSDLTTAVPGLQMAPQNVAVTPFIRGLGNRNTSVGDESAAAIYVDGVYIADLASARFSMNNIDRIEVLKGPQGTLFGRNAAAGVIQIITRDPSHTPSADLSVGYGNYDTSTVNFYGTIGVTDNLAGDIAIYDQDQVKGWGVNTVTGHKVFFGSDFAARSKWLLTLGDKTTIKAAIDYENSVPVAPPAFTPLPGQFLLGGVGYQGFYKVAETVDVHGGSHQAGGNVNVVHDFDFASLVSISSYRRGVSYQLFDQDGTAANLVTAQFHQYSSTFTQELQLLSSQNSPFKWIVGAYYFHNVAKYDPLDISGAALRGLVEDIFSTQTTDSYAGYAQATFDLGEKTHLTTGVRYSVDDRHIVGIIDTNLRGPINPADQSATFASPTWRVSLDHQFESNLFGFIEYSRGFKSGVFNAVAATTPAVRPETIDAFEAGFKSEWLDRRVRFNASAFYDLARDIQLQVPVAGATILINAAGATIKGVDADFEVVPINNLKFSASLNYLDAHYTNFPNGPIYTPNAGPAYGYTQTAGPLNGDETPYSPPLTAALTGQYKIPTSKGSFTLIGSYYYSHRFYFDAQNIAPQPQYSLVNGSVAWSAPNDRWSVELWGRNLGSAKYYTNIIPQAFGLTAVPAAPLTFGATLRLHLG